MYVNCSNLQRAREMESTVDPASQTGTRSTEKVSEQTKVTKLAHSRAGTF